MLSLFDLIVCILNVGLSLGSYNGENFTILFQGRVVKEETVSLIEGKKMNLTCLDKYHRVNITEWDIRSWPAATVLDENPYIINNVFRNWTGTYHCAFWNSSQPAREITVHVLYPPSKPEIVAPLSVMGNTDVSLTCSSEANPPANYTWREDPSYYSPVISTEPTISTHIEREMAFYCTVQHTMNPTFDDPVVTMLTTKHLVKIQDATEKDVANNVGPVVAAVVGWVVAVLLTVTAVFLYLRNRNAMNIYKKVQECPSHLRIPGIGGKSPDGQKIRVLSQSVTKSSDEDFSNEQTAEVPDRGIPKPTVATDRKPTHSYIEVLATENMIDEDTRPGFGIYEALDSETNVINDVQESYDDLNETEMDARNVVMQSIPGQGYEMPIGRDGRAEGI